MIGKQIHNYVINAQLGKGGMGTVYRATDNMLGREVALKMLHPQLTIDPQFLERFKKEARVLAQLLHPNIALIYNFIEFEGNQFMVMEYVQGTSLDDLVKKYHALPAEFIVPVFIQALEGLHHAHRKNVLHRDIKPANLMITEEGTLKLMDFGIAKVVGEQKMTQANRIVGTIEFMAPELIEGKDASVASDIYAMGATMYELISGKTPFEADTDFNMMQAILKNKINPPEKVNPQIPEALNDIVMKALEKNPENRYTSARAFQHALMHAFPAYREINFEVLAGASFNGAPGQTKDYAPATVMAAAPILETRVDHARPAGFMQNISQTFNKHRKAVLIGAGVLLALILLLVFLPGGNDKPTTEILTAANVVNAGDSLKKETPEEPGSRQVLPVQNTPVQEQIPDPEPRVVPPPPPPPAEETTTPAKKKEVKKPVPKKTESKNKIVAEKPVVEEKKPEPAEPEKKDVYIDNANVEVSLSLTSHPDLDQREKTAQRVSFKVNRPVYYQGVLIVKAGATASGTLTIGRVRTDITIDQVTAANGSQIQLRAASAHGRRKDIETNQPFSAYIRQGTRINF